MKTTWQTVISAGLIWVVGGVVGPVSADVINLQNGTTIEGNIVSETDSAIVVEMQTASGSIMQRTINKVDVLEMTRETAEQKHERAMQRDYQKLQQYRLNPASSFTVAYYDQVIKGVFQPFLDRYPASAHVRDVQEMLRQWEEEKNQVAAGRVKHQGRWVASDEAKALAMREQAGQHMDQGKALLDQKQYEKAIQFFDAVVNAKPEPNLEKEARKLTEQAYQAWATSLQSSDKQLDSQLEKIKSNIATTTEARATAVERYQAAMDAYHASGGAKLGSRAALAMELNTVKKYQAELEALAGQQARLQQQSDYIKKTLPKIQEKAEAYRVANLPPQVATVLKSKPVLKPLASIELPSASPTQDLTGAGAYVAPIEPQIAPPPDRVAAADDMYTKLVNWLERNWAPAAIVGVLLVGFFLRMMKR